MDNKLNILINTAKDELCKIGLAAGTLSSYHFRAFKPIRILYNEKYGDLFDCKQLLELKNVFFEQCKNNSISHRTLNWRCRGINILLEVYNTGMYSWKVYNRLEKIHLNIHFSDIVSEFKNTLLCSVRRKKNYESIVLRLLIFVEESGIINISLITPNHLRNFIIVISSDKPKSMDDVMTALRKFFKFLNDKQYSTETFWMLLSAPRARSHKVFPCMEQTEIIHLVNNIDCSTNIGKRDFAILTLAVATGLRAGDLALLKHSDIDWKKQELHFCQSKTNSLLILPLSKNVLNAVADYILHARPTTDDTHLFIRTLAPYNGMNDGVSIACIFRKYLRISGISHVIGDGKTLHGIRRSIGTAMVSQNIPVTTVSQVLGHTGIRATKQYISMDLNGLRKCTLSLESLWCTSIPFFDCFVWHKNGCFQTSFYIQ